MELTREKVLAMEAGRELDVLVAERVFGLQVRWEQDDFTDPYPVDERDIIVDTFSEDILAAWNVVEKFTECTVRKYEVMSGYRYWSRMWIRIDKEFVEGPVAQAETAPLAICRAALLTTIKE